ncbi:hypothetical protein AB1Y20_001076 [Prymnesium parvum]|uniref:Cyclic nucleotide-binding domain-containing protein n=1 Tax=Prymnesium parvum TaxID=97485 RepID=A0AB34K783_PRYPA
MRSMPRSPASVEHSRCQNHMRASASVRLPTSATAPHRPRTPALRQAVDDTAAVPSHYMWKAQLAAIVNDTPERRVANSQKLVAELALLAGSDVLESELLQSSSPSKKAAPFHLQWAATTGKWIAQGMLRSDAAEVRELTHGGQPEQPYHGVPLDPNAKPDEHQSPEYISKATNMRRAHFSLTSSIEIEYGGSRHFRTRPGFLPKDPPSSRDACGESQPRALSPPEASRRTRGKAAAPSPPPRAGQEAGGASALGQLGVEVGGEEASVRFGSDVDRKPPADLPAPKARHATERPSTATRWQPMASASDKSPLWRSSDGLSWMSSCGAPMPPAEEPRRVSVKRPPSVVSTIASEPTPKPPVRPKRRSLLAEATLPSAEGGARASLHGHLDEKAAKAAQLFDERHQRAKNRALHVSKKAGRGSDERLLRCFEQSLNEVRRNRFYVDEEYNPFSDFNEDAVQNIRTQQPLLHRRWVCDANSIWAARAKKSNSKSIYETDESLRSMFNVDWEFVHQSHGLEKYIRQLDASGARGEEGMEDAIDDAREMLLNHARLFYGAFMVYSVLHASGAGRLANGEQDVYNMKFNAYLAFARDCQLVNAKMKASDLEVIWVQVNAVEEKTKDIDKWNHARAFTRHEWLEGLVRIAIQRYIVGKGKQGEPMTVADAIDALAHHISPLLPREAHQDSNMFRRKYCYHVMIEQVIVKNMETMRNLFDVYSEVNADVGDVLQSSGMMSIGEWMVFVEDLDLLDNRQISDFNAKMIFTWSRIRGCTDHSERAMRNLRNLSFQDFLEALIRLSMQIALPLEEEIYEAGARNAGEYLIALENAGMMPQFLKSRKQPWWKEPPQSVWLCLEHLITYMVWVVKSDTASGGYDEPVTFEEARNFEERRRESLDRNYDARIEVLSKSLASADARVRAKLLDVLRAVDVFAELEESQLEQLRDAMVHAVFNEGDYVFEQDEEGDTFYIIVDGKASIIRVESSASGETKEEERVLSTVSAGAYFGERALLKSQLRYAGVRADTRLKCMYITREGFEEILGPLHCLVPDKY